MFSEIERGTIKAGLQMLLSDRRNTEDWDKYERLLMIVLSIREKLTLDEHGDQRERGGNPKWGASTEVRGECD